MGLKARVKRLEKAARGNADYIELADGIRYWFDVERAQWEMFRYLSDSMVATYRSTSRPEPPEIVRAVAGAKDRKEAFSVLPLPHLLPIEVEALIERGEIVPRPLVAGGSVDEPIEDLSE